MGKNNRGRNQEQLKRLRNQKHPPKSVYPNGEHPSHLALLLVIN